MSAGPPPVDRDLGKLAPKFAAAVRTAIEQCNANGMDAFVYEAMRSDELQKFYYSKGRTLIPPEDTVTNASSNRTSWHGFGLAVDVISKSKEWAVTPEWQKAVADIFLANQCKWGGNFSKPDYPHFQWGRCKASPSALARQIMDAEGLEAVWKAVGAI